jgi:16S rRNA (cytosine1402-N4)-methyltransferase
VEAEFAHHPVMGREVVELLRPVPPGLVVDCTLGGGGHSALLLEARADLTVLGIDRDADAVAAARDRLARFGDRVRVVHGGFEALREIVARHGEGTVMGVLMDLGVSSPQLDRPERGFSYRHDAPLDMRMDARQELTAAAVVNTYAEERLAQLLAELGEERHARRIARSIVAARPLRTTRELVEAIRGAVPRRPRRVGGHPARRTFQAIRMEVNRELEHLDAGLDESVHLVGPGGRLLVLSYHSLEDRLVKRRFEAWAAKEVAPPHGLPIEPERPEPLVRVLTRRPLRPDADEIARNPRADSARLRAVERLPSAG